MEFYINIDLSAMEMSIANVISREVILKEYIDMMREYYEFILIDCMRFRWEIIACIWKWIHFSRYVRDLNF